MILSRFTPAQIYKRQFRQKMDQLLGNKDNKMTKMHAYKKIRQDFKNPA